MQPEDVTLASRKLRRSLSQFFFYIFIEMPSKESVNTCNPDRQICNEI